LNVIACLASGEHIRKSDRLQIRDPLAGDPRPSLRLQAGIPLLIQSVLVKAGADGFGYHVLRRRLEGNQKAHPGFLPLLAAPQVAHVFDAGLAASDLDDDLLALGLARVLLDAEAILIDPVERVTSSRHPRF
jgi:hypothetical protein